MRLLGKVIPSPFLISMNKKSREIYSTKGETDRRRCFTSPRRRLASRRLILDETVECVLRRGTGFLAAARTNSTSRPIASLRFCF
jgi:hypothetical protein